MRCARVLQRNNKYEIDRKSGRKEREISLSVDFSSYGYAQCLGEGNGNPVQYSCLENPMDREAWWAAVYGVPQSQT